MKGYKALNQDMSSQHGNMTYELNTKYTISGELEMHKNGFHFCKKLEDIECHYIISTSRIFEVEADGEIINNGGESCAESITLLRELSKEEIRQYFIDNQERILGKEGIIKQVMAEQGVCLDKLINDKSWRVRRAVAKQGYGLDKLINDENEDVREAVAKQGYGLDNLINDVCWDVRAAVAKQGYGLDKLIDDEDCDVRFAAEQKLKELV